tara:strand:- start:35 stop:298 length:264 start_codon:yes stop_codon:yes gene_type:complete
MKAHEARKAVEQTKQYQHEEKYIIEEGIRCIEIAVKGGRMGCSSGLHFGNKPHWDSIIKHWQGLGYTIEWAMGGGYNPRRYPSAISW